MKRLAPLFTALVIGGCICDPTAQNGTALRIRVNIEPSVTVTQLRFSAAHGGTELFAPVVRPEAASLPLESGGSLLALLSDALDGQEVTCAVEGLNGGEAVTQASATATVKRGYEVPCVVRLLPSTTCDSQSCAGCCVDNACVGGGDSAACGSGGGVCSRCQTGQRCASGACLCDAASCGGCCSGVTCLDGGTDTACGKSGESCASCPSPQTCSAGACACDGGPCGASCTAITCPTGCCSAGSCVASAAANCGVMGVACSDCRTGVSDRCSAAGRCVCGNTMMPCAADRHCVNGQCVCDSTVCAGCCRSNGTCDVGTSKQSCGSDGGTCRACSGALMCGAGGVCQ